MSEQVIVMKNGAGINIPKKQVDVFVKNGWVVKGKAKVEEPTVKPNAQKKQQETDSSTEVSVDTLLEKKVIDKKVYDVLRKAQLDTLAKIRAKSKQDLIDLPVIGKAIADRIIEAIKE